MILQENECQFQAIFEQAALGIYKASPSGQFFQVNQHFCDILGYTNSELLKLTLQEIIHPDDLATDIKLKDQIFAQKIPTYSIEKRYIRKDGQERWVKVAASCVSHSQSELKYLIGIVQDITENKQIEEELQQSRERFHIALKNSPLTVFTQDTDLRYTWINNPIYHHHVIDVIGKSDAELFLEADAQHLTAIKRSVLTTGVETRAELLFHINEEVRYCDLTVKVLRNQFGKIVGISGAAMDITERKKIQAEREKLLAEIEQQRLFLEAVLQQMPAGVIIQEAPTGKLIMSNPQAAEILQHPLPEAASILEYSHYYALHPNGQPYQPEEWPLDRAISQGEIVTGEEIKYLCGDGSYRIIHANAAPIRNHKGEIIAGVIIFHDITEIKQAEAVKRDVHIKEVLLKEIHHRVKNNLQIVSGLFYLQSRYTQDPQILNILKDSQNRLQSMALIHEKFYGSSNLDKIDFGSYVRSLTNDLVSSYAVDANLIKLKIEIQEISLDIDIAIPCGLMINELVSNAIKYGFPEGYSGEIIVQFQPIEYKMLKLVVSNTGDHWSQPITDIQYTKSLGLRLVHSLATKQLEGTVELETADATTFIIKFPLWE